MSPATITPLRERPTSTLPIVEEVRFSPWVRRTAWMLCAAVVIGPLLAVFAPWVQNITGAGRVAAYAPLDRQQLVEAPIAGRIVNVWVIEGSRVAEGEPLLEISDIDPNIMRRLREQKSALDGKLLAAQTRIGSLETQIESLVLSRDLAVEGNQARVDVAKERLEAAKQAQIQVENDFELAELQHRRYGNLVGDGVVSRYEADRAKLDFENADAERRRVTATVNAASLQLDSAKARLGEVREKANADIGKARADLESARGSLNDTLSSLADLEVKLARQASQLVTAPRDGTVLRMEVNAGGEIVGAGDPLLVLVPDSSQLAVELWVNGNDAPLVSSGRKVRLQFEGWPAVQFSGWPSVAVGTFGGTVSLVDATDDGQGRFRVLVTPDPDEPEWPEERFLRQGVRARGWILLEEVSLGYEVWRRLNAFPPVVTPDQMRGDSASKSSSKSGSKSGSKSESK